MFGLHTPCDVPDADMKICVLIDGHALIQSLGRPHGCYTFGDLARVFMQIAARYIGVHITRVVFDRYIGEESSQWREQREWEKEANSQAY